MATERQVDWEAIESQYRAGLRSVRSIARDYGVSHTYINKIAKELHWPRNLAKSIKDAVSNRMVSSVANEEKVSTAVVKSTTNEIMEVLGNHRTSAKKQQEIISKLSSELYHRMLATTLTFDDIKACALIMNNITQAFGRLVTIDRVSYGLEEDPHVADLLGGNEQSTQKRIIVNFVKADITNNYGENSRSTGGLTGEAAISVQ